MAELQEYTECPRCKEQNVGQPCLSVVPANVSFANSAILVRATESVLPDTVVLKKSEPSLNHNLREVAYD